MLYKIDELLLLEHLTYLPDMFPLLSVLNADNQTVREYMCQLDISHLEDEKVYNSCMNGFDWKNIILAIENNQNILDAYIVEPHLDTAFGGGGGISAVFLNEKEREAVIAFRGTASNEWVDDFEGANQVDSLQQVNALEWYKHIYEKLHLENYTVTVIGHSKGGNKAKYITILNDTPDRCVSFDGQGVGYECAKAHEAQINEVSGRIRSISAHNDYVNILLGCIAGECVFVKNLRNDAVGRHSSYSLLKSCEFDSEGNIINTCEQEPFMRWASALGRRLTGFIDILPEDGNRSVSELIASAVAAVFSNEFDEGYEKEKVKEAAGGVGMYVAGLTGFDTGGIYDLNSVTESVYIDMSGLAKAAEMLTAIHDELFSISEALAGLRGRLDYEAATRLAADTVLRKQENMLLKEGKKIGDYAKALEEISGLYSGCENELCERIRGTALTGQSYS